MTGRKKTFTLFPLDFQEFLLFKGKRVLSTVLKEFHFRNLLVKKGGIDPERIKPFNHEMSALFEEFVLYGGYPKVVLTKSRDDKLEELRELFESYELKDVNVLFDVANLPAFRNLFKVLAGSVGNLLNINFQVHLESEEIPSDAIYRSWKTPLLPVPLPHSTAIFEKS